MSMYITPNVMSQYRGIEGRGREANYSFWDVEGGEEKGLRSLAKSAPSGLIEKGEIAVVMGGKEGKGKGE